MMTEVSFLCEKDLDNVLKKKLHTKSLLMGYSAFLKNISPFSTCTLTVDRMWTEQAQIKFESYGGEEN